MYLFVLAGYNEGIEYRFDILFLIDIEYQKLDNYLLLTSLVYLCRFIQANQTEASDIGDRLEFRFTIKGI